MSSQELQLIFVPGPGMGHIVSAVEFATLVLSRDTRLSITFLLINDPVARDYTNSRRFRSIPRLRFLNLSELDSSSGKGSSSDSKNKSELAPIIAIEKAEKHKPLVREAVLNIMATTTTRVVGFVADMFCKDMFAVADEFSIPSYLFFTSSAGFLSLLLAMQRVNDEEGLYALDFKGSDRKIAVSGFRNLVPAKVLPSPMMTGMGSEITLSQAQRFRKVKGVFINTFQELEPNIIQSLSNSYGYKLPPIYPVGPLLNLKSEQESKFPDIISWLDQQPPSSVVFLCFGSTGSFSEAQIKHLSVALESSGRRFLWSLRKRNQEDSSIPVDILPEGFMERTDGIGKLIGWAPQAAVLSHAAVGGFVSHCGWNSILESIWFGVPMAAWPIYAEQQLNAFQLVVEMGLAVEIRMDYRDDDEIILSSEEIETGIQQLMEGESVVRERVKEMREKCLRVVEDGGSSHKFMTDLVDDILHNSLARKC